MRVRTIPGFLIGALMVLGAASQAAAQQPAVVGAGLSFISDEGTGVGFAANVSKEVKTTNQIGWAPVGDFSWHTDDGFHWTVFGGGLRANIHPTNAKFTPFGQFLIGASRFGCDGCGSETELSLIFGGGVHVPINGKWNALVQFDAVNARYDGGSSTGKRITLGVSTNVGK